MHKDFFTNTISYKWLRSKWGKQCILQRIELYFSISVSLKHAIRTIDGEVFSIESDQLPQDRLIFLPSHPLQ
jgi:hypothetical protein